jgi:hypothetical protein
VRRCRGVFIRWSFCVFFQRQLADMVALAGEEED